LFVEEKKPKVVYDIDDIIMKDLLNKGIVKGNAKFIEMENILKNDPEYQKIVEKYHKSGTKLTEEEIAKMDGI
jgi:hypothetical protein